MKREILNINVTLGPLRYQMQAHDNWAAGLLSRLAEHVDCRNFSSTAQRQIHIVKQRVTNNSIESGVLPLELAELITEELPVRGWQITGDDILHLTWRHADTHHSFWTGSREESAAPLTFQSPFQLPMDLIFHDIIQLGGCIVHGGLAVYRDQGIMLTAPPGGGKTTAFSTTPEYWHLKSDDATLVWPERNGSFRISPLPTWSVLLGVNPQLERIGQWQVGIDYPLEMVLFLHKADAIALNRQRPLDAAFPLYRAFSEYPTAIMGRAPYRCDLFRAASALARTVPTWSLQLPRKNNFWPYLEEELARGGA